MDGMDFYPQLWTQVRYADPLWRGGMATKSLEATVRRVGTAT
eukprot:gene25683-14440_t